MAEQSMAAALSGGDLVERFREADIETAEFQWSSFPDEHTNWIEEQRAWRESCILMDQSFHLVNYYVEGPDALAVNSHLGVNHFDDMEPPSARQHPVANPDGYMIGDPVLFCLGEESVVVTGNRGLAQKWIQYNVETGDWDAEVVDLYSPYKEGPPVDFRFEVQGPNARDVMTEAFDGPLPDVGFFGMDTASIDGVEVHVLGHGMAAAPGYEVFGPWEHHDRVRDHILDIGAEHGIRQLGSKSYKSAILTSGWLPVGIPAVYENEAMAGYREWLTEDAIEANWSLGGSFHSPDIEDYYLDPVELGYEHLVKLDRGDFVSREALAEKVEEQTRTKVTFVWDGDDVVDVYASLFSDGPTKKFLDIPDTVQQWTIGLFDRVEADGELVGLSINPGYDVNVRSMLSLGVVDLEHSEPGTELTLVWGDEDSVKRGVERHEETEIGVTVRPAPYDRSREDV